MEAEEQIYLTEEAGVTEEGPRGQDQDESGRERPVEGEETQTQGQIRAVQSWRLRDALPYQTRGYS